MGIKIFEFKRNKLIPKWILNDPSNQMVIVFGTNFKAYKYKETILMVPQSKYKYLVYANSISDDLIKTTIHGAKGVTHWHNEWMDDKTACKYIRELVVV